MPRIVTVSEAKIHLRVTNNAEDDLIGQHIDTAGEWITNYLNRDIPGMGDSPVTVPKSIKDACLLIVNNLFQNREGMTEKDLKKNPTIENLLYFYRVRIGI